MVTPVRLLASLPPSPLPQDVKKNALKASGATWLAGSALLAYNGHENKVKGWADGGQKDGRRAENHQPPTNCTHHTMRHRASWPAARHSMRACSRCPPRHPLFYPTHPPTHHAKPTVCLCALPQSGQDEKLMYAAAVGHAALGALCLWRGFAEEEK